MAGLWWSSVDVFRADVLRVDDARLREMHAWAAEREVQADRRGMGRNPKARRHFHKMKLAADEELDKRGLLY